MKTLESLKHHLKRYIHPQWGSIVGSEKEIRLAVLRDEVELWEERLGSVYSKSPYYFSFDDGPDTIPYLGYIKDTLQRRIVELEETTNEPLDVYEEAIKVRSEELVRQAIKAGFIVTSKVKSNDVAEERRQTSKWERHQRFTEELEKARKDNQ